LIKRILLSLFCIICVSALFIAAPQAVRADEIEVHAKSAILMNMNTGKILYAQNPDRRLPPASLAKVLSLYLAHEAIRDGKTTPEANITISRRAGRARGSRMHVRQGQHVPLSELMTGMAVVSGNGASIAVAEHIGGDVNSFVRKMNRKARQLGMNHSCFKNPNGLPAKGQFTTARDVLALSRAYLRDFSDSLEMHSLVDYTYGNRTMHNHNRLAVRDENVDGLKTGFTRAAGFHIIATAKKDDTRLIAIVMGARSRAVRDRETQSLLEEGFRIAQRDTKGRATQASLGRDPLPGIHHIPVLSKMTPSPAI
jgi:D-alanyl-D-alanine carboxypeptidase (penicillin-binding protein 5/6)